MKSRARIRRAASAAPALPAPTPDWWSAAARILGSSPFLAVVLALAGALRCAHVLALRKTPLFDHLQLDHRAYDEWAQRIRAGDWLGAKVFFVDPLYAYFLGGLYALFGHDLLVARIAQVLLGVVTCALTALLGRRVLGSAALGNLAALITALFVPGIFYEGMIEKTALGVFLFTLALVLFLDRSRRAALLSGIALGLATLARGTFLLLIPAGVVALLLDRRDRASDAPPITGGWRRLQIGHAALFLAGALAVVGVATARNWVVGGEFVLTTANAGQNLYIGQHPKQDTGAYRAPDFVRPDPRYEEDDFRAEAERRTGRRLTTKEVSSFWIEQALAEIEAAPGAFVQRTLRKLWLFWHDYEVPDNVHLGVVAEYSPVLKMPFVWMGQLFPLALLGGLVTWRANRRARLLTLGAVLYCAGVVAFFVLSRLRVQILPILAVLAAAGAAWLWAAMRTMDLRRLATGAAVLAGGALVSFAQPGWIAAHHAPSLAIAYNNLGGMFVEAGDVGSGIIAYERAVATSPATVPASMRTLGDLYLQRREYDKAERHMRRVLELRPGSRNGREALVRLYEAMLRDERHRNDPGLRRKLADAYRSVGRAADAERVLGEDPPATNMSTVPASTGRTAAELIAESRTLRAEGRWGEAIAALQEAIRIGPYDEGARYLLGSVMEQHATPDDMVAYWSRSVGSDPKPQTSLYFWAVGLERGGDVDGAVAQLRRGLETDPAHEMSENRWGTILEKQGKLSEALEHYRLAIEIFPEFRGAHENCARVLSRLGRRAEAEDHLERARRSNPNTPRRYVYWARYLLRKGRSDAAVAELERAVRANPNDEEARRLLAGTRGGTTVSGFDDRQRATLVRALAAHPAGTPVWFAVYEQDAAARELGRALRAAFGEAGWVVRGMQGVPFAWRSGVFLFAAEEEPPAYVRTVQEALQLAGIPPKFATGYRSYRAQMRTNPDWRGFEMAPDQTYLVVIGPTARRP